MKGRHDSEQSNVFQDLPSEDLTAPEIARIRKAARTALIDLIDSGAVEADELLWFAQTLSNKETRAALRPLMRLDHTQLLRCLRALV